MIVRNLMLAAGVLFAGAATATPASAGDGRVGVEVGHGGIVIHADWGDRDRGRARHRDHDHDRGRGHARHVHGRDCRWIDGHHEIRIERVWVPGTVREEYVPPVYGTRYDACGRPYRVIIRPGHVRRIEIPGHYESRKVRVFVPGGWSCCR